jgi:hypothetical protein
VAAVLCSIVACRSHNGASPVALLRASFLLATSADDRAEDLALGAVTVCLQQLDIAVDEDRLALLESVIVCQLAGRDDGQELGDRIIGNSPSAVQRINESTRPLTNKRLANLARLLADIATTRPVTTPCLQIRIVARLGASPWMHASDLTGTVNLIRRALELVTNEFRAAGDGTSAAVKLLARDCGAEEAFFRAGVGEGRVPGVSGVVCGGERALGCSWVGDDGGCGREDGAEDEGGVHCVGELGVRANGAVEVGELTFGLVEVGFDGVLEGVVGRVDDGCSRWLVVSLLLSLDVKVDGGRHLPGVPEAGQRLYVYDTTNHDSPCASSVRARFAFRAGHPRAYTSHSQPSTPGRAAHTACGLQRVAAEHGKRLALS